MKFGSLFSGCGGMDLGLEQAGMECVWQVEKMPFALKILMRHWCKVPKHTDVSTFCAEDGPVKTIRLQVQEKVTQEKKVVCSRSFAECCEYLIHVGLLQKMFQGFYPLMPAETFAKCSPSSKTSGMAFRGEYLIVNTSESPNNAVVCSLSDILETRVPQKFYLSKKAVEGMTRRSLKWGRSGYVFLQEMVNGKTQVMKTLSLQQLAQMMRIEPTQEQEEISLQLQSGPKKQEIEYKEISLRRLTPVEKEKCQGFPMNWTHPEGLSLVMQLQSTSQNGLVKG